VNKDQQFDEICLLLAKTLKEKNRLYGNSYDKTVAEYGDNIMCVRIEDKLNRLKQLILKGEKETIGESVIDTFLDIAGYSILPIILLNEREQDEPISPDRTYF
jgi:hypothetical protein